MHGHLLYNGEIRDAGERLVSPGQIGYLNGWGVFSTLRVYDGVPFAWERHWARMEHDARRMRVPLPADSARLYADLLRLIEANQAWNATLRVMIERNRGGMFEGPAAVRDADILAFTREVTAWGESMKLGLVPNGRHAASEFAGAKVLSWSENLARYERAHEQGFDEVLLLNERGEASECTSANIFAVRGAVVRTPPLSSGCLPGVTRATLLEEVRVPGLEIREEVLMPADLEAASEVFVTSTTRELLRVSSIQGLNIREGSAVRDRLAAAFCERVKAYLSSHTGARPPAAAAD